MRALGGHLGALVSALVDDQLAPQEAERCWRHVEGCGSCREVVQQELWVKDRLHAAPAPRLPHLPDPRLTAALAELSGAEALPTRRHGVRRGGAAALSVAALGVGTVSVALTGVGLPSSEPAAPRGEPTVVDRQPAPLTPVTFRRDAASTEQPPSP